MAFWKLDVVVLLVMYLLFKFGFNYNFKLYTYTYIMNYADNIMKLTIVSLVEI